MVSLFCFNPHQRVCVCLFLFIYCQCQRFTEALRFHWSLLGPVISLDLFCSDNKTLVFPNKWAYARVFSLACAAMSRQERAAERRREEQTTDSCWGKARKTLMWMMQTFVHLSGLTSYLTHFLSRRPWRRHCHGFQRIRWRPGNTIRSSMCGNVCYDCRGLKTWHEFGG